MARLASLAHNRGLRQNVALARISRTGRAVFSVHPGTNRRHTAPAIHGSRFVPRVTPEN